MEYAGTTRLPAVAYQALMDRGFRRSGEMVYRPACPSCRECVPIRVPVERFVPSRSQRRVLRNNADVEIRVGVPEATDEKFAIYTAYLREQHEAEDEADRIDFEDFLYLSPTETVEMTYLARGRIFAAGVLDVSPAALSSVYFYFDPAQRRRSPGIFGALCEIEECRRRGLPYWYVGFYVRDCPRMNYKARFRPHELLDVKSGNWNPVSRREE